MKIKGLLFGLFACAALAACTNEDIVDNNGNGEQEKVDANLKLVISAATNSSRAAEGDETLDGLENESNVSSAVVILYNEDLPANSELYKFPNLQALNGECTMDLVVKQSGTYFPLVIVNPSEGIENIVDGTENIATKYENILDYRYEAIGGAGIEANQTAVKGIIGGNAMNKFLMTNKEQEPITVNSNSSAAPQPVNIKVERVVSKITFKPGGESKDNAYSATVATVAYSQQGGTFWFLGAEDNKPVLLKNLAKAKSGEKVLWIDTRTNTAYEENGGSYGDGTNAETHSTVSLSSVTDWHFDYSKVPATEVWTVKLDAYALTNLSTAVYPIRHILKTGTTWSNPAYFGTLGDNDYIVDPFSVAKNGATFNTDGTLSNGASDAWFNNALNNVTASQEAENFKTYFKDLPTGALDGEHEAEVGKHMAYCLENVVEKDKQKAGLTTGVIFRGKLLRNGAELAIAYRYDKKKYYLDETSMREDNPNFDSNKVETFENGNCYYYAPAITHETGVNMEYAIMRNNIYVLNITGFTGIGFAEIKKITTSEETDDNFYLKLSAQILPWKVRLTNIEF